MPNTPDIPAFGSARVLIRFFLRLTILCVFAGLGHQGFGKTLEGMLMLAVLYCTSLVWFEVSIRSARR
jgi:hypothetical protein